MATLTEVFPGFFLSCKANSNVTSAKTGPTLLLIFVLFYVLFVLCRSLYCLCLYMCTELLPPGGYPVAVKYIISYHKMLSMTRGSKNTNNPLSWKRSIFPVEHNGTVNMFIVEPCKGHIKLLWECKDRTFLITLNIDCSLALPQYSPFLCTNIKSSSPICPPSSLVMSTLCVFRVQNKI